MIRQLFQGRSAAAIAGFLLVLASPPYNLFFLAWIGLIPLFVSLERPRANGFGEGYIAGIVFNTGILYWLAFNSGAPIWVSFITMVAGVNVVALGWGCAAYIFHLMRRRLGTIAYLFLPFSWATWEGWLSYLNDIAFPWSLIALTQSSFDPILQVMEFTGIWGVSFWTVALNVAIYLLWRTNRIKVRLTAFVTIIVLVLIPLIALWNAHDYKIEDAPTIRVMAVQGNVPPQEKWAYGVEFSWLIYDSLTRMCIEDDIDLAIWPETALPTRVLRQVGFTYRLGLLSNDTEMSILTGASDYSRVGDDYRSLNGAFLVRPDEGIIDRYAKQWLVPFGERVPFQWLMPSLGKLNFGQAEFLPGLRLTLFEVEVEGAVARFPALICYESVFPDKARDAVRDGANLLTTISNDAWYGRSTQPYQIAALSRFRCIETRRAMARASNTGISLLVDPLGRELARTNLFEPGYLVADLPLLDVETFYVKYGNLFLIIITVIYGLALLVAASKRKLAIRPNLVFDMKRGFGIGYKWISSS